MTLSKWQISGEYFKTCNCDYVYPCITSNLSAVDSHSECKVALAFT